MSAVITEMKHGRKVRIGVVVSDRMKKTRAVEVILLRRHPLYEKVLRHRKRFYAHDETDVSKLGDRVRIEETRPLSKLKRWRVIEVLQKEKV